MAQRITFTPKLRAQMHCNLKKLLSGSAGLLACAGHEQTALAVIKRQSRGTKNKCLSARLGVAAKLADLNIKTFSTDILMPSLM